MLQECDELSRNTIESMPESHTVCPFELSLDLSLWADCVIGAINYVFDPRATSDAFLRLRAAIMFS
jgi:hypothetical protein